MNTATLLATVLALLSALNNPAVPPQLRTQGVALAQVALQYIHDNPEPVSVGTSVPEVKNYASRKVCTTQWEYYYGTNGARDSRPVETCHVEQYEVPLP